MSTDQVPHVLVDQYRRQVIRGSAALCERSSPRSTMFPRAQPVVFRAFWKRHRMSHIHRDEEALRVELGLLDVSIVLQKGHRQGVLLQLTQTPLQESRRRSTSFLHLPASFSLPRSLACQGPQHRPPTPSSSPCSPSPFPTRRLPPHTTPQTPSRAGSQPRTTFSISAGTLDWSMK